VLRAVDGGLLFAPYLKHMRRQGGSRMTGIHRVASAALVAIALAAPAAAQSNVTQADIQRLQDNTYLAD